MADEVKGRDASADAPDAHETADLRARFATPIEADRPVDPDASSDAQFTSLPAAEQQARQASRR